MKVAHGGYLHARTRDVVQFLGSVLTRFFGRSVRFEVGTDDHTHQKASWKTKRRANRKRQVDVAFLTTDEFKKWAIYLVDHTCPSILTKPDKAIKYAEAVLENRVGPLSVPDDAERKKFKDNGISWGVNDRAPLSDRTVRNRLVNLPSPVIGKRGAIDCYFWPISSALFGGIGPHFRAILTMLASNAAKQRVFPSFASAMRSFIAEITRLQIQNAMVAISDYQSKLRSQLPQPYRATQNGSETE